jgi:hypothetical protein
MSCLVHSRLTIVATVRCCRASLQATTHDYSMYDGQQCPLAALSACIHRRCATQLAHLVSPLHPGSCNIRVAPWSQKHVALQAL